MAPEERRFVEYSPGRWGDNRDPVLDDPYVELEISVRLSKRLPLLGVKTIRDATQLTKDQILSVKGLGRKSVKDLQDALAEYGWCLAEAEAQGESAEKVSQYEHGETG